MTFGNGASLACGGEESPCWSLAPSESTGFQYQGGCRGSLAAMSATFSSKPQLDDHQLLQPHRLDRDDVFFVEFISPPSRRYRCRQITHERSQSLHRFLCGSFSYFHKLMSRVFTIGLLLCNSVSLGRTSQHVVNMFVQRKPKVWSSPRSIETPARTRLVLSSNTRLHAVTLTREKWQFLVCYVRRENLPGKSSRSK